MSDKKRDYCTPEELSLFRAQLEAGQVTIFRQAVCFACKCPVPAGFAWCSIQCMESVQRIKGVERVDEDQDPLDH